MKNTGTCLVVVALFGFTRVTVAESIIIDSELSDSYHFVDTYEISINSAPHEVWRHLVDMASWPGWGMTHESGPREQEGEVLRLYPGQEFFVQIVKLIPDRMMVVANLPSNMQGEESVGLAMITLTKIEDSTLVSVFMARHYDWTGEGPDPLRQKRASDEFREFNRQNWDNGFLPHLRDLAEGRTSSLGN